MHSSVSTIDVGTFGSLPPPEATVLMLLVSPLYDYDGAYDVRMHSGGEIKGKYLRER